MPLAYVPCLRDYACPKWEIIIIAINILTFDQAFGLTKPFGRLLKYYQHWPFMCFPIKESYSTIYRVEIPRYVGLSMPFRNKTIDQRMLRSSESSEWLQGMQLRLLKHISELPQWKSHHNSVHSQALSTKNPPPKNSTPKPDASFPTTARRTHHTNCLLCVCILWVESKSWEFT